MSFTLLGSDQSGCASVLMQDGPGVPSITVGSSGGWRNLKLRVVFNATMGAMNACAVDLLAQHDGTVGDRGLDRLGFAGSKI